MVFCGQLENCLWVRSIGKSGFRFYNPDFGFAIEREIRKRISTLRYLFLDFHFYRSIGKSEKGFEKLSLRTAVLHAHAYLAKRRPLFTRTVLQILFRISQSNDKKGNPKNPDLDFLIEIHPEDGFLGGEIRFRISR